MIKRKGARSSFFVALIMILTIFSNCSNKEELAVSPDGNQVKLVVQVAGIADGEAIATTKMKATNSISQNATVPQQIKFKDYKGVVNSTEASMHDTQQLVLNNIGTNSNLSVARSAKRAGVMVNGIKYRILLYKKSDGSFVNSVEATAGQSLEIEVTLGEQYQWYAYSYNTEASIAAPTSTATPTVETPIDKELLYASGDVTVSAVSTALPITFAHKLAQVLVEVNTEQLGGNIATIDASFISDSYFNKGTFNLKSGSTSAIESYTTGPLVFTDLVAGSSSIKVARFYTADPANLSQFSVKINALTFRQTAGGIVELVNPLTPATIAFGPYTPALGKVLRGELRLSKPLSPLKIVHAGQIYFGTSGGMLASYNLLKDWRNFGIATTSLVKTDGFEHVNLLNAGALATNLNAAEKPDIVILASDDRYANAADYTALLTYLQEGGVVLLMMEPRLFDQPYLQSFFNGVFNNSPIVLNEVYTDGDVHQLSSTNDEILNGVFGDVRGKYWGSSTQFALGLTGIPAGAVTSYSTGAPVNSTVVVPGVTMFKHNSLNLFWVSDISFLGNDLQSGTPSVNYYPFATNAQNFPVIRPFGMAGNGHTAGSMAVNNSIVFANLMAWAIERATLNGINTP
ncbi:fimbrillin family protein [Sphingobacterium sp. ML3W]|uniref:fimbrillin family protein n=1 Tax=Sphingobacterium sp. ML3W TaxID=1538644 RepID=UPI000A8AD06C|nr:fimbrillin family protein [Sphingobacterium sp. ML3W]